MADPREVEIKLELSEGDAKALRRRGLSILGGGSATREQLTSVYFDTPKRTLEKKGLTLRVRSTKAGTIQTVKAQNGPHGGLFDRGEWETAIEGPEPDRDALANTPAGEALRKRAALQPMFETVVDRTKWTVAAGRSTIEVALDQGRVVAGQDSRSFAELELELREGFSTDLFELARKLGASQPLKLGVVTKSERGYALAAGETPKAFKAEGIDLETGAPAAAAFRRIAHSCLRQFRLNETLVIETRSVEPLHEARVALRRLRSALSLFKDLVADETLDRLKQDLRTASQTLGDARNIDVYLARAVGPEAERDAAAPGVLAFLDKVGALREQAYDRVIETFSAATFRRLMIDLLAWIEAGPWTVSEDPEQEALRDRPIEELAAEILEARFHKVRKKGRHLERLEPGARHRVRIEVKKLRYATEFFAGLPHGKAERRRYEALLKGMKAFQELLGELNDLQTGHELALDLAQRADALDPGEAKLLFAAGHLSGEQDERVAPLLRRAAKAYEAFADAPKFWRAW